MDLNLDYFLPRSEARFFSFSQHKVGEPGTLDYRMHFKDSEGP